MNLRAIIHDDSGAITVDWVVLSAAVLGIGLATTASVRSGAGSVAGDINTSLTGASVGGGVLLLDGFTFSEHNDRQWHNMFASFGQRSDDDLTRYANGQSNNFMRALAEGDLETARYWMERRYASEYHMGQRGITDPYNAMTVDDMLRRLAEAGG